MGYIQAGIHIVVDGVLCLIVAFIIASIKGVRLIYRKLGDVFYG